MFDARAILKSRRYGIVRIATVSGRSLQLPGALAAFGLRAKPESLVEHDRAAAQAIVRQLLWKDMAYDGECMPLEQATSYAASFFAELGPDARFYSNGNVVANESWNPLTDSTFDAGIVCAEPEGLYTCAWFQDED